MGLAVSGRQKNNDPGEPDEHTDPGWQGNSGSLNPTKKKEKGVQQTNQD